MIIKMAINENEVEEILNFVGVNFFKSKRLEKYVKRRLESFCNSEVVDLKYLQQFPEKNTKVFAVYDENSNLVGGMTIKFYLWEKLRKQYFFKINYDYILNKKVISVDHIENILKEKFLIFDIEDIKISVELDTFAVREDLWGKGIGKKLFEKFIKEVLTIQEKFLFAFTIVLGKYLKIKIGEFFMKYFFDGNSNMIKKSLPLDNTLKQLNLPKDLFRVNKDSYGTVILSKKFDFKFLGYGKYLGEVWGYLFENKNYG